MSASNESKNKTSHVASTASDSGTPVKQTTQTQLLLRIAMVLAFFFFTFCFIGTCLPRQHVVESTIDIDASAKEIYPLISQLDQWKKWSVAWDFDSSEQINEFEFSEDFSMLTWRHDLKGTDGKIWIESKTKIPDQKICYNVVDQSFKNMKLRGTMNLKALDSGATKFSWSTTATLPSSPFLTGAFYGWTGIMYKPGMQGQLDRDLARLKEMLEK